MQRSRDKVEKSVMASALATRSELRLLAYGVRDRLLFFGEDWEASASGDGGVAVVVVAQ